jgi:hypothetical protein
MGAVSKQSVSIIVWPIAFLAVMLPLWLNLIHARLEAREAGRANVQVQGFAHDAAPNADWILHVRHLSEGYGTHLQLGTLYLGPLA